jgi:hypothetical protein
MSGQPGPASATGAAIRLNTTERRKAMARWRRLPGMFVKVGPDWRRTLRPNRDKWLTAAVVIDAVGVVAMGAIIILVLAFMVNLVVPL